MNKRYEKKAQKRKETPDGMKRKPMTVKELQSALAQQPDKALVAWVNDEGMVGYLYADEQQMAVDGGHVHIQLGGALAD